MYSFFRISDPAAEGGRALPPGLPCSRRAGLPCRSPERQAAAVPSGQQALRAHLGCCDDKLRVRLREDDGGLARPPRAPLRDRRDRQRKLAVQKQIIDRRAANMPAPDPSARHSRLRSLPLGRLLPGGRKLRRILAILKFRTAWNVYTPQMQLCRTMTAHGTINELAGEIDGPRIPWKNLSAQCSGRHASLNIGCRRPALETTFPLLPLRLLPTPKTHSSLRVSLECPKWDMIGCLLTPTGGRALRRSERSSRSASRKG